MAVSDPNAIERKTKAVAGWSPIRVQIMESAFRELSSDDGAVIAVRETRTDADSVWTSIGRIQRLPSRRTVAPELITHHEQTLFPIECVRADYRKAIKRPGSQDLIRKCHYTTVVTSGRPNERDKRAPRKIPLAKSSRI